MSSNKPQSQQSQSQSPRTSGNRIVRFVVDRDLVVDAEVIREYPDGALDLRGKFGQPTHGWKDVETVHEVTGEKQIFAEDVTTPDPRVTVRSRVRRGDESEVRAGKYTPGTWFDPEEAVHA